MEIKERMPRKRFQKKKGREGGRVGRREGRDREGRK